MSIFMYRTNLYEHEVSLVLLLSPFFRLNLRPVARRTRCQCTTTPVDAFGRKITSSGCTACCCLLQDWRNEGVDRSEARVISSLKEGGCGRRLRPVPGVKQGVSPKNHPVGPRFSYVFRVKQRPGAKSTGEFGDGPGGWRGSMVRLDATGVQNWTVF